MAISGTTNICEIATLTQFDLSGLSQSNLSTINITDENGLDVSECFGIETNIITVEGDNITLSGECDTSLEIKITEGVKRPVDCSYISYTQQGNGLLLFNFEGNVTSDNIHPDCCTALGFTPEINEDTCYYVCRWRDEIDPEDCNNYSPTFQETPELWQVFEFAGGGTVTTVPSVDCCYQYGYIEEIQSNGDIKCIIEVESNPCEGLEVVEPVPDFGLITFIDPVTGQETQVVPNSECCTSLGFNFQPNSRGGFNCFNTLISNLSLTITNDPCCEPNVTVGCVFWTVRATGNPNEPEDIIHVTYDNCNNQTITESFSFDLDTLLCVNGVRQIRFGETGPIYNGTPYLSSGQYQVDSDLRVFSSNTPCS